MTILRSLIAAHRAAYLASNTYSGADDAEGDRVTVAEIETLRAVLAYVPADAAECAEKHAYLGEHGACDDFWLDEGQMPALLEAWRSYRPAA